MTKEEILEDLNIGDVAKIYTESGEIFEGEVVDFGASGMKITLLGSSNAKRIIYSRIIEYEIEAATSVANATYEEKSIQQESSVEKNALQENGVDKNQETIIAYDEESTASKKAFSVDKNALFAGENDEEDFSEIRKRLSKRIDAKHRNEASRVLNMLEYAQKVHEYSLDNDRVKRIIAEYTQMGAYDKGFYSLIALLYQEFGEIRQAEEFYHRGGAYDMEFMLSRKHKTDTELFEIAVLAIEYNDENPSVIRWLCEYAVKRDNYSTMLFALSHTKEYASDILLYWYADKEAINEIPNKEDLRSEENIDYLKKLTAEDEVKDASISEIISSVAVQEFEENEAVTEEEEVYKGIVSYYKKDGGYGTIKNLNGGQIYFYIKQVKDLELQRILATEYNYKRRVRYTRGINFKGEVAADDIELDMDYATESAEDEYEYDGFLDDYDVYEQYGRIRSGNKTYNFIFDKIKDPFLYAEIMSRPYSVLDLEVRFNASDHKSKKTNKKTKIATDIIGKKEYSQQEIDSFISQRLITKKEADEWLGVSEEKTSGTFRPVAYEPLDPIGTVREEVSADVTPTSTRAAIVTTSTRNQREGEEKAVELLLPPNVSNPFSDLPKDTSRKKYYQDAHRYMIGWKGINGEIVGVDLDKSEELFIKAIQSMEQTAPSVANLVNIYIKKGGEYIVKGLQLLEIYGYLFPAEKLTNLRMQLIDKSGNNEALEMILLSAIPNCSKSNTVWQYMAKLAGIYYKQQKWGLAIKWFEKSLDYLDKHRSAFPQYQRLRNNINLRPLIIAKYNGGKKEEAIQQAKTFLIGVPDDPVMKSIVDGSFGFEENNSLIEDFDEIELQYEDELLAEEGDFSKYLISKLQDVNLSGTFNKVNAVYSKTQDGVFKGNSKDVKRAIGYILGSISGKTVSAESRSLIYIGVAKIILDSRNNEQNDNNTKISIDELRKYVGRYARYTADALVEKYATIDSIRYMYILALKNLVKEDTIEITAATNMLLASFFTEGRTLTDELHEMKAKAYNDSYYEQECVSIKDFLIATFMLQEKQEYVNRILNKAYSTPKLRDKCRASLEKMCDQVKDISTFYDFEAVWKTAQSRYYTIVEKIGKEIAESVDEYHMVESINQHVSRIAELMEAKVLWNQDEAVLKSYIDILLSIGNTFGKYTVEEKIDGFRLAELESEVPVCKSKCLFRITLARVNS